MIHQTHYFFVLYETVAMQIDPYCIAMAKTGPNQLTLFRPLSLDYDVVCRHIASDKNTPAAVLGTLSKHRDWLIRREVAGNDNTSVALLVELSKDTSSEVRFVVARNKNTPAAVLEELSRDELWYVRWAVAENSNTPFGVLRELTKDEDIEVCGKATSSLLEVVVNL